MWVGGGLWNRPAESVDQPSFGMAEGEFDELGSRLDSKDDAHTGSRRRLDFAAFERGAAELQLQRFQGAMRVPVENGEFQSRPGRVESGARDGDGRKQLMDVPE